MTRISAARQPKRPVRVALPLDDRARDGEVPVVAVASSPRGPWDPLPATLSDNGRAVIFRAPHFSWFDPLWVDVKALLGAAREQLDGLTSGATAEARAPSCPDEQGARSDGWKVASQGPDTIKWCFGRRDGQRLVTLVNARRYPLSIRHPGARTVSEPKQGWFDLSRFSAKVSPRITSLPPRESVTYAVDDDATFRAEADGLAQSLYQLQVGVELAAEIYVKFGGDKQKTRRKFVGISLKGKSCTGALQELENGGSLIRRCFNKKLLTEALGPKGAVVANLMTGGALFEFFRSELNAAGDELNGRTRYTLRVSHVSPPVLGAEDFVVNGEGWGAATPRRIFNGGDPAGLVDGITWRDWGAAAATGIGVTSIFMPQGGYYPDRVPAELRATRLGTCPGSDRVAYTRLLVRTPDRPRGPVGNFRPWSLNMCDYSQDPAPCGDVGLAPNSDYGAFEITAWDVGCRPARAVATAVAKVRIRPGDQRYETTQDGFSCLGYSYDSSDLPSITWTCIRGTAQVAFKRT